MNLKTILIVMCAALAGCQTIQPANKALVLDRTAQVSPAAPQPVSDAGVGAAPAPIVVLEPPKSGPATHQAVPEVLAPSVDIWERMRRGFAMPRLESAAAEEYARHYAASAYFQKTQARARRYLFYVLDEIERRGLPTELALLGFVESSMNPHAVSPVGAAGVFQFMPATGRQYAMRISRLVDDRTSISSSTKGAMEYLTRLHAQFNDYHLAMAAYNWGEGNVARAQSKNAVRGLPLDYLSLSMPTETRNYLPQLEGLKRVILNPARYGVMLPDIPNEPYFMEVPIRFDMDVDLALRLAGITEAEFFALNASVKRPLLIAAATPALLLPHDAAARFAQRLAAHKGAMVNWNVVRFNNAQWIQSTKAVNGSNATNLRQVNGIPSGMKPTPGSTLFVPSKNGGAERVPETLVNSAFLSLTPDLVCKSLTARKADTLSSIAQRFGLKFTDLVRWNPGVAQRKRLQKGQPVIAYVVRGTEVVSIPSKKGGSKATRHG